MGDLDRAGADIESNTRRVLETYAPLSWERLALTDVQVRAHDIPTNPKTDRRDGRTHDSWETEALSQSVIVGLVRSRLDALLPEPLAEVRVREREERERIAEILGNT